MRFFVFGPFVLFVHLLCHQDEPHNHQKPSVKRIIPAYTKIVPCCPKMAPGKFKLGQNGPKIAPRWAKMAQDGPKIAPRCPNMDSKSLKNIGKTRIIHTSAIFNKG